MKILVIGGGFSKEREISLASSKAIRDALSQTKHQIDCYDWTGDRLQLVDMVSDYDLVFPVLHGEGGEDGQVQSIIEQAGVTIIGSDSVASSICIDKQATKQLLKKNGIKVPDGQLLNYPEYQNSQYIKQSHVVKPIDEGSSFETFILKDQAFTKSESKKIEAVFSDNKKMLVEEYIDGLELTVPILEGKDLPVIEIIPPKGEWFSNANKYNGQTEEACPPRNISKQVQGQAIALANKVHDITGARHFSRVDMIYSGNQLYVLEINTIPGLTTESLFPKSLKAAGLNMEYLVSYLVELAKRK